MIRQNKTKRIILTTVAAVFALAILAPVQKAVAATSTYYYVQVAVNAQNNYEYDPASAKVHLEFDYQWLGLDAQKANPKPLVKDDILVPPGVNTTSTVDGVFKILIVNANTQCDVTRGCDNLVTTLNNIDNSKSHHAFDVPVSYFGSNLAGKTLNYKYVGVARYITGDSSASVPFFRYFDDASANKTFSIKWVAGSAGVVTPIPNSQTTTGDQSKGSMSDNDTGIDPIQKALMTVVNIVLVLIFTVVKTLLLIVNTLIIKPLLNWLLSSEGSNFWMASNIPPFVNIGWTMIRDLVNSLFVFVLIYSAVRLMLNKSNYGLRQIIVKVVVAAVVVNISLIAGQLVLQMAQVLIRTFVDPNALNVISQGMILGPNASFTGIWSQLFNGVSGTANLVIGILYDIAVVFVLGAFALLLVYRLAMLWLMLILAPIPYVVELFQIKSVPKEAEPFMSVSGWWGNFINLAFLAPVMAFMISLATFFATTGKTAITAGINQLGLTDQGGVVHETLATVIYGMFTLTILYLSLKIAKSMSKGLGDKFVEKITDNAQKWSKATGKSSLVFGSRGLGGALEKTKVPVLKQYGTLIKKAPIAPGIVSGIPSRMAAVAQKRLKQEEQRDTARAISGIANLPKGAGAFGRYLGAEKDAYLREIISQSGEHKKDIEKLGKNEVMDIYNNDGNEARKRAAAEVMIDKGWLPKDVEKFRNEAKDKYKLDAKKIYNKRPDLAVMEVKDTTDDGKPKSPGQLRVERENAVFNHLRGMEDKDIRSINEEALDPNRSPYGDLIKRTAEARIGETLEKQPSQRIAQEIDRLTDAIDEARARGATPKQMDELALKAANTALKRKEDTEANQAKQRLGKENITNLVTIINQTEPTGSSPDAMRHRAALEVAVERVKLPDNHDQAKGILQLADNAGVDVASALKERPDLAGYMHATGSPDELRAITDQINRITKIGGFKAIDDKALSDPNIRAAIEARVTAVLAGMKQEQKDKLLDKYVDATTEIEQIIASKL